jgi:polyphosphate:AMP phosphotransferase
MAKGTLPPPDDLRTRLLAAQSRLLEEKRRPLLVVLGGMAGAGKGELGSLLSEWMDPRYVRTVAFDSVAPKLRVRPPSQDAWLALPPKGKTSVFYWGWYASGYYARARGELGKQGYAAELDRANRLEALLVQDGAILVKAWIDLDKKSQRKRFDKWEQDKATSWRSNRSDWFEQRNFEKFARARDTLLAKTSTELAPWHVISGVDPEARNMQFAHAVEQALLEAFDAGSQKARVVAPVPEVSTKPPSARAPSLLTLVRDVALSKEKAEKQIPVLQGRLNKLTRDPRFAKRSVVVVFEGSDAAGKGGAIRRITGALDARSYRVVPIAAPSEEERAHPYLWRFWREVPGRGQMAIFDRSWYGRVLVERVEGYATETEWRRAYGEITDFERELTSAGAIVVKFWLAITKAEQLKRFKERQQVAFKQFKITKDDFRNREKWDAYEEAAEEMFRMTHSEAEPWTVVGANDKHHARVTVLKTLVRAIERAL